MITATMPLAIALRDASHRDPRVRRPAVASLGPSALAELGVAGPAWQALQSHPRAAEVQTALFRALDDASDAPTAALAGVGLAWIGEVGVLPTAIAWETSLDAVLREHAILVFSFLGVAARGAADRLGLVEELRSRVLLSLRAPHPEVRFQAAAAVAELGGTEVESVLCEAFLGEAHPEVQDAIVRALLLGSTPSPTTCDFLEALLLRSDIAWETRFEAALGLAGAGRHAAIDFLWPALAQRNTRDDALEALAVVGHALTATQIDRLQAMTRSVWTPGATRVRAAYVIARARPDVGHDLLDRLARHPRRSVRDAVRDAKTALERLGNAAPADSRETTHALPRS